MAEVQNILLDRLNIRNGSEGLALVSLQEASPCATCSRFDHVELDCPVMAIQGQNMYRQGPSGEPSQQGRPNYSGTYPNHSNTLFLTILCRIMDIGGTMINPILNNTTFSNNKPALIKDSRRSSDRLNRKPSRKLHASSTQAPRQTAPASDPILATILKLIEQMTRMNSCVEKIQDFVKTNVQPTTDKKGKQVTFTDQLPSQATTN